ncbi:uncharacterized protein LOC134253431 [Saccostrea cucullata]|uniref:uncharacterized protein LOC134253431 n=1 Tax=Saccostrea cuccullata TaxID=36930 RepID=UPI002ED66E01
MPKVHCIAEGCSSDSRAAKSKHLSFHPIPKVASFRKKWLDLIRRDGLEEKINKSVKQNPICDLRHLVVCSDHFVDGKPTPENPYPTLFRYNNYKRSKTTRKTNNSACIPTKITRYSPNIAADSPNINQVLHAGEPLADITPAVNIKLVKQDAFVKSNVCYPYVAGEVELQSESLSPVPMISKCTRLTKENKNLKEENLSLKKQLEHNAENLRNMLTSKISESDKTVKHFLGLPSLAFLLGFINTVSLLFKNVNSWKGSRKGGEKVWQTEKRRKPGKKRKLSLKEEFIIIMLKLRLGLDNITLSTLFGVSLSQISNMFTTWINFLYQYLEPVLKWPSKEKIRKHLPLSFKLKYPGTTSIIDCTEIFIQKPRNPSAQAATWSNYKSHNTLKALVAIQPNGAFTFVSNLWSGNISDRKITELSGYLDKLQYGDEIMADRGFQIRDLAIQKGAKLNMPPFTRVSNRSIKGRVLTSKEIQETRKIASVRIHVERAIRRLKSFKLLGQILPLKLKNISSQMLRVAAAFCNFLPPLVRKYKA